MLTVGRLMKRYGGVIVMPSHPLRTRALIGQFERVFTSRFHAGLFAIAEGRECILVGTAPSNKGKQLMGLGATRTGLLEERRCE